MEEVIDYIHQINYCARIHKELYGKFEAGLAMNTKQKIDCEDLYRNNEPLYYVLLRSLYDLEDSLRHQNKTINSNEKLYLEELYKYGRKLLNTIKFFPKLTYFLWQKKIGNYNEEFYNRSFNDDHTKYLSLQNDCAQTLIKIKRLSLI